jgi:hypothetical protein
MPVDRCLMLWTARSIRLIKHTIEVKTARSEGRPSTNPMQLEIRNMEKSKMSEALAKAKTLNITRGLIVRSSDGRAFFLPAREIESKVVHPEANAAIAKMFARVAEKNAAIPKGYISCDGMLEWLLANDPFDENWRRFSAIWMESC